VKSASSVLLKYLFIALFGTGLCSAGQRLNIVLITADDMNFDSSDVYGGPVQDLTPNLDRLAGDGMRFHYAYSTVAVCQPVREIMHTGLYPHRNGAMGFFPLKPEVRTLNQQLHDAGYLISMIGKNPHYQPAENFCVDFTETRISRHPSQLAAATRKFVAQARDQQKPFFHHVNCTDPHRPFIGAGSASDLAGGEPPSRWIKPEEITRLPGFLEELPDVRREVTCYYTSVRRLDDCVGAVLQGLKDAGVEDNTLIMFYGGDHGMAFPFAKSNDYENSSRGALIVRWSGVIQPGGVDRDHLVSTLDFTPTLLEAAGLPALPHLDGRSFAPVLKGGKLPGWDRVFTFYNANSAGQWFPMRCLRTKDRSYIWNAWSDGQKTYRAENMGGLTWKALLAAAATNAAIKARTELYLHRVPEEFYDMTNDGCERRNRIDDPARQAEIQAMRDELLALLRRTGDPLAEAFAQRDQRDIVTAAMQKLSEDYTRTPKKGRGGKAATKEAAAAPVAKPGAQPLLTFRLPATIIATEPVTVHIAHHFAEKDGEQALTVTLLTANHQRIERKVIKAKGEGEAEVTFAVPAEQSGKSVKFAAFVGETFTKTPLHIESKTMPVK
jgi:N-sulfoglucosamine sulfohydrolase